MRCRRTDLRRMYVSRVRFPFGSLLTTPRGIFLGSRSAAFEGKEPCPCLYKGKMARRSRKPSKRTASSSPTRSESERSNSGDSEASHHHEEVDARLKPSVSQTICRSPLTAVIPPLPLIEPSNCASTSVGPAATMSALLPLGSSSMREQGVRALESMNLPLPPLPSLPDVYAPATNQSLWSFELPAGLEIPPKVDNQSYMSISPSDTVFSFASGSDSSSFYAPTPSPPDSSHYSSSSPAQSQSHLDPFVKWDELAIEADSWSWLHTDPTLSLPLFNIPTGQVKDIARERMYEPLSWDGRWISGDLMLA